MWLRPTTSAEQALQRAQGHAAQDGSALAGRRHLLQALADEPDGLAMRLLRPLGVSPQDVITAMTNQESDGAAGTGSAVARWWLEAPRRPGMGKSPESHRRTPTEQAWAESRTDLLDAARREAKELRDAYVGTEHLLLCLLRETGPEGASMRALGATHEGALTALVSVRTQAALLRSSSPDHSSDR